MNSARRESWRIVNEVIWFFPGLLGTAGREHRRQVLGCCTASGVSRDPLAKLVGRKFLSGCFCGVRLFLKPLAWGNAEPEWAAYRSRGWQNPQGGFSSLILKGECLLYPQALKKPNRRKTKTTGTKDCIVREVGVALGVREEGLWPKASVLPSYPIRPCNASSVPARAARRVPRVPACQAGTVPGREGSSPGQHSGKFHQLCDNTSCCFQAPRHRVYI